MGVALSVVRDEIVTPVSTFAVAPETYAVDIDVKHYLDIYQHSGDRSRHTGAWKVRNISNFMRGLDRIRRGMESGLAFPVGLLWLAKILGNGDIIDYGLVSCAVVTDVGCQKIVAVMNTSDAATGIAFKFHGLGTGGTAEAAGDTALVTELTTEYNPNSTRATGTQTTGGTSKVYRTVATNTLDSGTPAITEHGVFSAASAGSLLDRSLFSAINLNGTNGDGLQSTYDFTTVSGG